MALRNGSQQILPRNTVVRLIGAGVNRNMGTNNYVVLDTNSTTGITRIAFNNVFGYREVRDIPSTWIEATAGAVIAANQGEMGLAGGFNQQPIAPQP